MHCVCVGVSPSVSQSVSQLVYPSVCQLVCQSVSLSASLSISLSVSMSVCLSLCACVCMCTYTYAICLVGLHIVANRCRSPRSARTCGLHSVPSQAITCRRVASPRLGRWRTIARNVIASRRESCVELFRRNACSFFCGRMKRTFRPKIGCSFVFSAWRRHAAIFSLRCVSAELARRCSMNRWAPHRRCLPCSLHRPSAARTNENLCELGSGRSEAFLV